MEKPMAPDERDRMFDKALARHLRSAAPAGQAAEMPGAFASQGGACPDPETLAAYHERSLLPEQLNSLKEHIVGCANCQTVLAHLETTDEIPLQAAQEDQVLAQTASARVASASSQTQVPEALPRKSRRARLLRGARWQWLAPAGAIAAGLLVWIALHENYTSPLPSPRESESKMAQNKVPPAPVPSLSTAVTQGSVPEKSAATLPRPQSPVGEPAIANGRTISGATKQNPTLSDATGARLADSLTDKEARARKDRERDAPTDELTAANHADLDAKNLPVTARQTVEVQSQSQAVTVESETAQSQNLQTPNQSNNSVSQNVRGPSPSAKAEPLKKAKRETAPPPAPPPPKPLGADGSAAASYSTSESLVVTGMISNPRLISPPGSNFIWRAGRSGLIELSKDSGSSWSRQTSGVLADLLTGSAPSDQVCWIVGRAGAILLTTDGGAHWKLIHSPLSEDLGGVRATDALHATIWNARNTRSFETNDGGLTWTPVPSP